MARQAGLGKSLHEVLESLKPAESWPEAPRESAQQLAADPAHGAKSSHRDKKKKKKKKKKKHKG